MAEFSQPTDFEVRVHLDHERAALREHRRTRAIPARSANRLLLATWNVANFGIQDRKPVHLDLIAELLSPFELVALQEVNDDLRALRGVKERLPRYWRMLVSEASGNRERQAFLYDSRKVALGEKVGKLTVPPPNLRSAGGEGFRGFDRNPYLASFEVGRLSLLLANVHSIWAGSQPADMARRMAETRAIAWWCDRRANSDLAYTHDILALGDFNLPEAVEGDPIFDELTRKGLQLPDYQTVIGTNIAPDQKHYDQVAYFPEHTGADLTGRNGVFDWDAVLFRNLWEERGGADYDRYAKWAISDHRLLWVELAI